MTDSRPRDNPERPEIAGRRRRLTKAPSTAEPFDLTLPAISKHIKVLERAGLVERGHRAQYRRCTLDTKPLQEIAGWVEHYRPIWDDRFDRMDDYLREVRSTREDHDHG